MSFIQTPTAPSIDTLGTGALMNDVHLHEWQKAATRARLARHGAEDLAWMLGVQKEDTV